MSGGYIFGTLHPCTPYPLSFLAKRGKTMSVVTKLRQQAFLMGYFNSQLQFQDSISRRGFSATQRTAIPKDLQDFEFKKKTLPRYIRWSSLGFLVPSALIYYRYVNRKKQMLQDRERAITDYVYIDLAKGDRYVGRMLIGVFGDDVPMTVNNFLRLVEGYKVRDKIIGYKNTKIHAVIPDKIVLAGDVVTGEGSDSLSIYGPMFPDENFSQPFLNKGDIAMYSGKPHANGSQFMITLRKFSEGNGKYVVFGTLVKGNELLRLLVSDVNPNSKALDFSRSIEPVRIVSCGVYSDPSQGPPFYLADKEQGMERKLSYGTGHPWQPLTDIFEMGRLARLAAERDMSTGGKYERELRDEYRGEIKKYLEGAILRNLQYCHISIVLLPSDRRKYQFLQGTPDKRNELHQSVFQEEYRRRDLSLNRRLAYQRRQKVMEKKMLERWRVENQKEI